VGVRGLAWRLRLAGRQFAAAADPDGVGGAPRQHALAGQADSTEPTLPNESSEATLRNEPTDKREPDDPIDRIDPEDPMDRIDPAEPIERIDPVEPCS